MSDLFPVSKPMERWIQSRGVDSSVLGHVSVMMLLSLTDIKIWTILSALDCIYNIIICS